MTGICFICLDETNDRISCPYGHYCHKACLQAWADHSSSNNLKCPFCKNPIDLQTRRKKCEKYFWLSIFILASCLCMAILFSDSCPDEKYVEPNEVEELAQLYEQLNVVYLYEKRKDINIKLNIADDIDNKNYDEMSRTIWDQIFLMRDKIGKYPPKPESKESCQARTRLCLVISITCILLVLVLA
jgi:hypothetical protein